MLLYSLEVVLLNNQKGGNRNERSTDPHHRQARRNCEGSDWADSSYR